jgi:hypothetical protein
VRALFLAFPDLSFEATSAQAVDSGRNGPDVAVPWLMRGTHTGPLARYFPLSSYSVRVHAYLCGAHARSLAGK